MLAQKLFYEVGQVWGKRPPSTKFSQVNSISGFAFDFSEDGNSLTSQGNVIFEELSITNIEFRAALHRLTMRAKGDQVQRPLISALTSNRKDRSPLPI